MEAVKSWPAPATLAFGAPARAARASEAPPPPDGAPALEALAQSEPAPPPEPEAPAAPPVSMPEDFAVPLPPSRNPSGVKREVVPKEVAFGKAMPPSPAVENYKADVTPIAAISLEKISSRSPIETPGMPKPPRVEQDSDARAESIARAKKRIGPKSKLCIGIDLGTTYSCAAIVENGRARVIPSRKGGSNTPSVVAFDGDGHLVVGEAAVRQQSTNPRKTIVGTKRLIGKRFHSPSVREVSQSLAYELVEGPSGEAAVKISDRVISLEEISSYILREVRESVVLNLKEDVNRAVITCPAYYNERQREAVRVAGELAGFHVERVLNEPTAAALNYGFGRALSKRKILIYDLGGGIFDASLMQVESDVYEVLATSGDTFLGGIDFDGRLVRLLVKEIQDRHGIDPTTDAAAMARLNSAAERAKRELTDANTAGLHLDYFVVGDSKPLTIDVPITRATIEKYVEPLVERTLAVCQDVCARASIAPSEVEDIILVGGQSRSPIVRKKVREFFGKDPRREVHPDEAVALGAAQYASSLGNFEGLTLIDALPMSIGVGLPGGRFKRVIERDTKLPVSRVYRIHTTRDRQQEIDIDVFQGEEEEVQKNEFIGTLRIAGLPEKPKGEVMVVVTFELNGECILNLSAAVEGTSQIVRTKLLTRSTPEEVAARLGGSEARGWSSPSRGEKPADGGPVEPGATRVIPERPGRPPSKVPQKKSGGFFGWIRRLFGGDGEVSARK
jgi:molecular chaperone DnaK